MEQTSTWIVNQGRGQVEGHPEEWGSEQQGPLGADTG